jgi:ATP-dependent Clp protease ATP-binding subunit ClpC
MFETFTDRARLVVVQAQEEARAHHHDSIGTGHVLLGLIHGEGLGPKALDSLGISLDTVRQEVEEIIGQRQEALRDVEELIAAARQGQQGQQGQQAKIPFQPEAKKVLELSLQESRALGHHYVGTEHVLLGLIREGDGVAARVLAQLGADPDRAREQVVQLLSEYRARKERDQ